MLHNNKLLYKGPLSTKENAWRVTLRPYRLYLYSSILASGRERVQLAEAAVHQPDRPQEERERGSSDRICRRNHAPHFRHQAS